MTVSLILQAQQGDSDATMALIEQFNCPLKKYAFKLHYEDAYHDLRADFIALIKNIRLDRIADKSTRAMVAYIYTAIYNSYIKKLINLQRRQQYEFLSYEALSEREKHDLAVASATDDSHPRLELTSLVQVLTKRELLVLKMFFQFQYRIPEIASIWGVREQTVRRTRKRALKKLSKWLAIEPAVKIGAFPKRRQVNVAG